MASYNIRQRDPLLDSGLQALLNKRGKEMLGVAMLCLAGAVAVMLASYSPQDPSWMAATDAPVNNGLGRLGAAAASPLIIISGYGAWGLVLALAAWGIRFVIHRGEELLLSRVIFVPIAIALTAVWAASLVPSENWGQSFGLGGLFGDTILGALLTALPMNAAFGVKLMSVLLTLGTLAIWAFVLGFVWYELGQIGRFLGFGLILSYAGVVSLMRHGARGSVHLGRRGAQGIALRAQDHLAQRRAQAAMAPDNSRHSWPAATLMRANPAQAEVQRGRMTHAEPGFGQEPSLTRRAAAPIAGGHGSATAARSAPPVIRAQPTGYAPAAHASADPRRDTSYDDADYDAPVFDDYDDDQAYQAQPDPRGWSPQAWPNPAPPPQARSAAGYADRGMPPPMPPQAAPPKQGLLAKLNLLSRRPAENDIDERAAAYANAEPAVHRSDVPHTGDDRIKARISDAVRARSRHKPVFRISDVRGAPGAPAAAPHAAPMLRPEPPVTAGLAGAALVQSNIPPVGWHMPAQTIAVSGAPVAAAPVAVRSRPQPAQPSNFEADLPIYPEDDASDLDFAAFAAEQPDYDAPYHASPVVAAPQYEAAARPVGQALQRRVVQTGQRRPPAPSRQAMAEAQPALQFQPQPEPEYELPPLGLLASPEEVQRYSLSDDALEENARMLENVLDDYGVRGEIVSVRPGPVVTMYELEPAPGLKASRVIGLADDIARSMSALSARVSTVPGRSVIGIELPNAHREKVVLREILAARDFGDTGMKLPLALGKDIGGEPIVANLAKMPHLLIAGTTGSGKSVAINTMILSLLYKLTPAECRLIMIDPKMLELSVYDGIPHLLSPVVTDPKKAVVALKWVVGEMEDRYRKMSKMGVRNIDGFNGRVREALDRGEMFKRTVQTGFDDATGDPVFETEEFAPETIPYIVVIVDEMADLMMVAGKEIEACIQRLAQMARASGIHLIMATQRPSVDVITGTIKANFPTRISFQVTSKIDSRTILGEQGAEQLLGMGDMLYMAGGAKITRIHGPFVSDEEVEEIVNHLKSFGPPSYMSGVVEGPDTEKEADIDAVLGLGDSGGEDALYDQAVQVVIKDRKCSTSYIQRKLGIGYNKAARLVEQMEDQGIVTTANHVGKREILVPEQG